MAIIRKQKVKSDRGRRGTAVRVWQQFWLAGIFAAFFLLLTFAFVYPDLNASSRYDISVGEIAPEDIIAPREVRYVSELETTWAREQALANIDAVYDTPDPRVSRQQVRIANQIMTFTRVVRDDSYANQGLKRSYLGAIETLSLSDESRDGVLTISNDEFELLEDEVINLIEELMSGTVLEGKVDQTLSQIELQVNPELPEKLIPLSVAIASDLIAPNSSLNEIATQEARQAAVEAIPDITRVIQEGEVISRAGEPVTELDREAMQVLGLTNTKFHLSQLFTALLAALVVTASVGAYITTTQKPRLDTPARALPVLLLFLIFVFSAEILISNEPTLAYVFPASALALTITALYGIQLAALLSLLLAVSLGLLVDNSLAIMVFVGMSSLIGATSLRRQGRLNTYFMAGLAAALGGIVARLIFELEPEMGATAILQLMVFPVLNGLLSAGLALVILLLMGSITGMVTPLKLLDLMRTDHPLQKLLQQEGLGTYQHTLTVANLAESAAEVIGADSLLTRVGTLYHDIGKLGNPGFFIENRLEGGRDPHEGLSPQASARIIMSHVDEGVRMARRAHLPEVLINFITEHHGTMPAFFFLNKAREEAEEKGYEIDESIYYYKGPRPQSRETAILMLCDSCASAVRAATPNTIEEIEKIVTGIIQQRIDHGQLDDSNLTLNDINLIKEAIVRTLKGMYHPRIKYPEPKKKLAGGDGAPALPASTAILAANENPPSDEKN